MKTILEDLFLQACKRPDHASFCDETESLTFSDTAQRCQDIGTALLHAGACREPVLVFLPRSARMIACFFGVLAAGCCYVPVDAEMGERRIRSILSQVQPRFALCDGGTLTLLQSYGFSGAALDPSRFADGAVDAPLLERTAADTLDVDAAYIVFTSGSTGAPKGVVGTHRAMLDYCHQITTVLGVQDDDVFAMQAPLYVDACLKEILSALRCGATVWLVPKPLFMTPVPLVTYLNDHGVTILCWVVPALTMISALRTFDEVTPKTLRTVAFGSEVFPPKQLRLWRAHVLARYLNLYGPTECTGMTCWYEVERDFSDDERVPIGKPFDNAQVLLLDAQNHLASEGELCIRGTSLCAGYYKDPVRTAAVFVQNPCNDAFPDRIYRTGDLGRRNARGELEFLGRKDNQIKHMGHRIELGELEAAAQSLEGVTAACAVFDPVRSVLALGFSGALTEAALLTALRARVPSYLLPSRTVRMDALPTTPNGKTDRKAVEALCFARKE